MSQKFSQLQMVVLDWAGTAVDHGSIAPIVALEEVFLAFGVPVSRDLLRLSMGIAKIDHIRQIIALPQVRADWHKRHGSDPGEREVEELYAGFTPRMVKALVPSSKLIPGVKEFVAAARSRALSIGATTGYTRPMLDTLLESAAAAGYSPDVSLCPDDVDGGRPHPWMCFRLGIELRVSALWRAVKIGDTESDIQEGRNAGMWTIGITRTGNGVGRSLEEWKALDASSQVAALVEAEKPMLQAGAHYIAESAAECMPILEAIDARLANGERP